MLRKGGNISAQLPPWQTYPPPHTPLFERAFQSFLSQSFTLTQQASGERSAVRMRATGWAGQLCRYVRIADASSRLLAFKCLWEAVRRPSLPFIFLPSSPFVSSSFFPPRVTPPHFTFFLPFFSPLEASPRNVEVGEQRMRQLSFARRTRLEKWIFSPVLFSIDNIDVNRYFVRKLAVLFKSTSPFSSLMIKLKLKAVFAPNVSWKIIIPRETIFLPYLLINSRPVKISQKSTKYRSRFTKIDPR